MQKRERLSKRSQITIFIIIAIFIISGIVLIFLFLNGEENEEIITDSKIDIIKSKTDECIHNLLEEGIYNLGLNLDNLEEHINLNLKNCTRSFSFLDIEVSEGEVSSNIILKQNNYSLLATIKYPISIEEKGTLSTLDTFTSEYNLFTKLYLDSDENNLLKKDTLLVSDSKKERVKIFISSPLSENNNSISLQLLDKNSENIYTSIIASQIIYNVSSTFAIVNPIELTLPYIESQIPEGYSEEDLTISYWEYDAWHALPTSINSETKTLEAELTHLSIYSVVAWKQTQINRYERMSVNIVYDKNWVLELQGNYFQDGQRCPGQESECVLYSNDRIQNGLNLFWWAPGPLSMRLYRGEIRFTEAFVGDGDKISNWPADHYAKTTNIQSTLLDGNNHTLRINYLYDEKRMKVFMDNSLVADYSFEILEMPNPLESFVTMGFQGTLRYYVEELPPIDSIISQVEISSEINPSDVKCSSIGSSAEDGFFSLATFNDKLYAGGFGYNHLNKMYSYPEFGNVNPGFQTSESVCKMIVFNNQLYANTESQGLFKTSDGNNWESSLDKGTDYIGCGLAIFQDYIYATFYDIQSKKGLIYRSADGLNWQQVKSTSGYYLKELVVYKDLLYAPTINLRNGEGGFWVTSDGLNWNWQYIEDERFYKPYVWNDFMWISTTDDYSKSGTSGIWKFDGNNMQRVAEFPGYSHGGEIHDYNGYLFATVIKEWKGSQGGGKLVMSRIGDIGTWQDVCIFPETEAWALEEFQGKLYVSTKQDGNGHGKLYAVTTAEDI